MTEPREPQKHVPPLPELSPYGERPDFGATFDKFIAAHNAAPEPSSHSRRNRLIAAVAGLGVVTGGIVGGLAATGGGAEKPRTSIGTPLVSHGPETSLDIPEVTTGNTKIDTDFRHAISVDTCATKVTFNEVAATYNRVFGPTTLGKLNAAALGGEVAKAADALSQTRQKLGMIPLPAGFEQLYEDSHGAQQIPLEQYKQALKTYTGKFGIKEYYDWSTSLKAQANLHKFAVYAQPMSTRSLSRSEVTREEMTGIMSDLSMMPPHFVKKDAARRRIAIGKVTVKKDGIADSQLGQNMILFDAAGLANADPLKLNNNVHLIDDAASHEVMHALVSHICYPAYRTHIVDEAYASLNGGFYYSDKAENKLEKQGSVQGYTSIEAQHSGKVAFGDGYGASDAGEDEATLFGERVLYTPSAADVYFPQGDRTIIYEKIAYWLARLQHEDADAAEYYVQVLQAGRVLQAVYTHMEKAIARHPEDPGGAVAPYQAMGAPLKELLSIR